MRLVAHEVQHRAGDDRVHAAIRPRQLIEFTGDEVGRGCNRRQPGGQRAYLCDGRLVAIDTETGEAVLEKEDEVATVPAAGVEHTTPAIEMSPCELVEEVDVDVAEGGSQLDAGGCHKGLAVAGGRAGQSLRATYGCYSILIRSTSKTSMPRGEPASPL